MAEVDPFVIEIPRYFLQHQDRDVRNYFEYLSRWLHDMWIRTGADQDQIGNQAIRESFPWDLPEEKEFQHDFSFNDPVDWNYASKSANYTAADFDVITASQSVTITLPAQPDKFSEVIVRNGDGSAITVNGNGKNVNFRTSVITKLKGTVLHFRYLLNSDEWAIV